MWTPTLVLAPPDSFLVLAHYQGVGLCLPSSSLSRGDEMEK